MQTNYSSDSEPSALNNVRSKSLLRLEKNKIEAYVKNACSSSAPEAVNRKCFPVNAGNEVNRIVFYNWCKQNTAIILHSEDTKETSKLNTVTLLFLC